jgi:hypothetical protein
MVSAGGPVVVRLKGTKRRALSPLELTILTRCAPPNSNAKREGTEGGHFYTDSHS